MSERGAVSAYKAWCPDNGDEDDALELPDASPGDGKDWALDAEDAAKVYVNRKWSDMSYPDEVNVCVRDPEGALSKWTVTVEMVPRFAAREIATKEQG
jgi:hypothetical protein